MQSFLQYQRISKSVQNHQPSCSKHTPPSSPQHGFHVNYGSDGSGEHEEDAPRDPSHDIGDAHLHSRGLVGWEDSNDGGNPQNWTLSWKIVVVIIIWFNAFTLNWSSGANSQANALASYEFGVSPEVEALSPALYVLGVAVGAPTAGPISESAGRNPLYIGTRIIHCSFMIGSALARNIQTQLICRFFAGIGASSIIAIHGASMADIFGAYGRSLALPFVACGSFFGTSLSPVAGGWIAQAAANGRISWKWCDWIAAFISGLALITTVLFLPETFAPALLKWKAAALRQHTGDGRFMSQMDLQETFLARLRVSFSRAWQMTTHEPIVQLLGLWLVAIFVVLFGFLRGFTYLFQETFGFSDGLKGTVFSGIAVGVLVYTAYSPVLQSQYKKQLERSSTAEAKAQTLPPESRLPPAYLGGVLFPLSMFLLGSVNQRQIPFGWSFVAVVMFGFSWASIAVPINQYILDVYGSYAGSALASITCYRYAVAFVISMSSGWMFDSIGSTWACMLLSGLAALFVPAAFVFHKYGATIRAKSRFARQL